MLLLVNVHSKKGTGLMGVIRTDRLQSVSCSRVDAVLSPLTLSCSLGGLDFGSGSIDSFWSPTSVPGKIPWFSKYAFCICIFLGPVKILKKKRFQISRARVQESMVLKLPGAYPCGWCLETTNSQTYISCPDISPSLGFSNSSTAATPLSTINPCYPQSTTV